MRLVQGTTLGSYEIVSLLGAGGMGEVYRARDPRLGREVAIKVLPDETARDAERVARFEREARALAALNHPNVATLHGFESAGDRRFLVMEMVEGEDLATRIERGAIPVDEAVPLFLQIAEGLEAAHEKGILHRDLKPANIKIGRDGRVKILDFGLAKAMADEHAGATRSAGSLGDLTHSPTLTAQATRAGTLLGTAAYMSPEQARGMPADPRADVWAFGCCFYEALTARRPFLGEDAPQTLAAVLKDTPDWTALPADLPRNLVTLLRRCLEKNRRARVQSAGDLRVDFQESLHPSAAAAPAETARDLAPRPTSTRSRAWAAFLGMGVLAAGLAIGAFLWRKPAPASSPTGALRVPVALAPGVVIPYGFTRRLAISPDGRRIAYVGFDQKGTALYVQDLHISGSASRIERTDGALTPFFSPDGESLGYLRGGDVEIAPLSGGTPRTLVEGLSLTGGNARWEDNGSIYLVDLTSAIEKVVASTGARQTIKTSKAAEGYGDPQQLPGGRHLLHRITHLDRGTDSIVVTAVENGEQTILFEGGFAPRYVPTGHLLVAQEDLLLGMTFDVETLEVGPAVPVLRGLTTDFGEGVADYDVSESGTLVFLTGALEREGWLVRLTPGREPERLNRQPTNFNYLPLDLSPDGRRVAVDRNDLDIWIFDLESRDFEVRLTTDAAGDWEPAWDWSGQALAFASMRGGGWSVYARTADGLGDVRALVEDRTAQKWPKSWSPDGRVLLFEQFDRETNNDLWAVEAGDPTTARPFLQTSFDERHAAFSPDGRWVAYSSVESGRWDVYVTSYPDRAIKRKVSREGGLYPRWSADSGRLFYGTSGRVMVVEALDAQWTPSTPEVFVEGIDVMWTWDVAPDGKSVIALERRPPLRLHLVQNWFEELERLVPRQ